MSQMRKQRTFRESVANDQIDPVFLSQREQVIEGMRKAGVPEG